jgi:hypothetical protein
MSLRSAIRAAMNPPPEPEPLVRPVSCWECGRTYSGPSAHAVAHDQGRCLPDSVTETQLDSISGVYCLKGRK